MSRMGGKSRIEAFRAGAGITRYHTMTGIWPERVGQHSAEVAAICYILDPEVNVHTILYALTHDIGEFATGDIPAHVKKAAPAIELVLEKLEYEYVDKYGLKTGVTTEEYQLVKTADALQLCFYALHEVKGGNKHYKVVFLRGMDYLRQVQWPSAVAAQVEEIATELWQEFEDEC